MEKKPLGEYLLIALILLFAIAFVLEFGGSSILRLYIESGIGNCQKIPILCMEPEKEVITLQINKEYLNQLLPYEFPAMKICLPKGFTAVQELKKKAYYKKWHSRDKGAIAYLNYKEPNFFISLYPQLKKQGINNNYEFVKQIMYARQNYIENLTDAFFVIMKGIFTPDVGDQRQVKMVQFAFADTRGFINYNFSHPDNYFDCNVINGDGGFFKIYIKDKGATLDLDQVLAIISTAKQSESD